MTYIKEKISQLLGKFKHNKRKIKTKEINNRADTVISIAILTLTLLFIIYCITKPLLDEHRKKINPLTVDNKIHKLEFKEDESLKIIFDRITTSEYDYDILRDNCIEYAENNYINTQILDTSIKVTENTYIDTNDNIIEASKDDTMYETGPIYLQDMILMRFVNEQGKMKVIASKFRIKNNLLKELNGNNELKTKEYITVDEMSLSELFQFGDNINSNQQLEISDKYRKLYDNKFSTKINKPNITLNGLEQNDYIEDIKKIFIEVLRQSATDIDDELKEKALIYFTYDGYNTIINGVRHIKSGVNTNITFIQAGKSDLSLPDCDRILMQIETKDNDTVVITNIIIKLDSNMKVFDIDII